MDVITKNDFAAGDVVLYHGTAVISRLIRLFDGTEVNHAAVYLGDGTLGEAIGKGLSRQTVPTSLAQSEYVIVRRLKTDPGTMLPVLDKATTYLANGNRYGYEQIVLLAFLGLTRKLAVNGTLRWLLRKLFDEASSWLMQHGDRQPMICSEFVYRCYDEARPAAHDPYALDINPFPASIGTGAPGSRAMAPVSGKVHRDSLLAWTAGVMTDRSRSAANVLARTFEAGAKKKRVLSAAERKMAALSLDELGDRYLEELKRKPEAKARAFEQEAAIRDTEMLAGVRKFSEAWYRATVTARPRALESWSARAAKGETPTALDHLLRTAADFVTPGDLYTCGNLFSVGKIMK